MADNLTQEEIEARLQLNETIKQASAEIAANGRISAATQAKLDNSTKTLTKDFDSLGTNISRLSKTFYEGDTSASAFSSSITSGANVAAKMLSTRGPLGAAVGGLVKAIAGYTNLVTKQADQLFNSYQDLAGSGATGARGVTEVFENLQKFGYSIKDLGKFSAIIKANSETLAIFGGTAAAGAKAFGEISKVLQYGELGEEFTRMGLTVDNVNSGLAGYLKIQQLSGVTSKKTTAEMVQSSTDYIKELDLLAKLTGQTREGVQAQQEKALQQEQFAAYQYKLQQTIAGGGQEGKIAQAQLDNVTKIYQGMANQPGLQKGFLNALTGNLTDPDTQKLMMAMPQAYAESQKKIIDANQFQLAASKDINRYLKAEGTELATLGMSGEIGPRYQELLSYQTIAAKDMKGRVEQGKADQIVTDNSTDNLAAIAHASRDTTNNLQSLVNIGVRPVTAAMSGLNKIIRGITGIPGAAVGAVKPNASGATMLGRSGTGGAASGATMLGRSSTGGAATTTTNTTTNTTTRPTPKAAAPRAPGGGGALDLSGLPIKGGPDGQATAGGESSERIIALAHTINNKLGGDLVRFTGFNDRYHQGLDYNSAHKPGHALDFTITDRSKSKDIAEMVRGLPGAKNVKDEYSRPSSKATGGHIHAEVSGYKFGGIATGPESGYETTLHGTEAVVPLPNGNSIPVEMHGNSEQMGLMSAQLSRLDDIVRVMQNQLGVSQKLLQYAQ